jgi:dihydroorotate dehydrogenase
MAPLRGYALLRRALFRWDPERAHDRVMALLAFSARHPGVLRALSWGFGVDDPRLTTRAFGLTFPNPIGLAAGLDKNGVAAATWPALGFGFAEVGTVTAQAQEGNPRPRLFRLPAERALINRMGFNNRGAAALAERIAQARSAHWPGTPLFVNVGKSRAAPLDGAEADYAVALRAVWPIADALVLNVSSPNTPGLRELQRAEPLAALLSLTQALRDELGTRPILLKIAPDVAADDLDTITAAAERYALAGIVATNTTVRRDMLSVDPHESGGLSGAPLTATSRAVLRELRARTRLPIISVGGIGSVAEAIERFEAGATLLQIYTAFVYDGPGLLRSLNGGLRDWLIAQGHGSLAHYLARRDPRN